MFEKMEHQFCWRLTFLEETVKSLEREKFDPNRLKLPLHHRHILDVSELVMSTGSGRKRPHTLKCAIAYILWGNKIQYIMA